MSFGFVSAVNEQFIVIVIENERANVKSEAGKGSRVCHVVRGSDEVGHEAIAVTFRKKKNRLFPSIHTLINGANH